MLENLGDIDSVNDSQPQEIATSETYVTLLKSTKNGVKYHCSLCNVELSGVNSRINHLDGKKHLKKLKQALAKRKKDINAKAKLASEIPIAGAKNTITHKKPSENIAVLINKSTTEIPFENILTEKSKTEFEMSSIDRTCKSLSLKRGSTISSKTHDNTFTNKSNEYIPLNYPHEYDYPHTYRTHKDQWNRNNDTWNNYENYYNDKDYRSFNYRNHHQFQGRDQRYFYQGDSYRNFSPSFRPDNCRSGWNGTHFSEFDPPNMHFNSSQFETNHHVNIDENKASNSHNWKIYEKESGTSMNCEKDNDLHLEKKSKKDLSESVNTVKNFNLRKHSISKKVNSPRKICSSKVVSVPGSARAEVDSPRQLRSSKKGRNVDVQNSSGPISVTISNGKTEMESSNNNETDKPLNPEKVSNRISHWLNPLNSRDKAEVNKLLNNYSKSKKKETLLKLKLRSEDSNVNKDSENNENLFHNLEELTDKINAADSEVEQKNDSSLNPSQRLDASAVTVISSDKTILSPKPKRRKKSNLSESSCNSEVNANSITSRRASTDKDASSNKKRNVRRSRASTDSSINIQRLPVMEYETQFDDLVHGKRRNSLSLSNKPKKHKCSGSECAIECAYESKSKSEESLSITENTNNNIYDANTSISVKKKAYLLSSQNCGQTDASQNDALSINMVENAKILDVEDLMKMFALENVTIKKEFDDPLIEAIKNVDVNFLMNVCDSETTSTNVSSSRNQSVEKNCDNLLNKFVDPKTTNLSSSNNMSPCLQSVERNCDSVPSSQTESSITTSNQLQTLASASDKHCNKAVNETSIQVRPGPSLSGNQLNNSHVSASSLHNTNAPALSNKSFETFETAFPGLSPFKVYVNISNELNKLQKEEEEKRNHLKEVDRMIEQHQKILNELTAQKIKLQTEEDNLISRRKTLTNALSQCVISDSYAVTDQASEQPSEDKKIKVPSIDSTLIQVVNQLPEIADIGTLCSSSSTSITPILNANNLVISSDNLEIQEEMSDENAKQCPLEKSGKRTSDTNVIEDNEEIIIIPIEKKIVPIIDLVESESPTKSNDKNRAELAQNFSELVVHKTIVNSLKVHNGYLYTCSNDYSAKRFNLKDSYDSILYEHAKRNVVQLCVETFSDTAVVFTLCSMDSRISSFKAEDGILLKTYSFESICAGISSGWGKVFAGLKSGLIVACNRKDSKDLVRNLEPVKSLACTMQGGLRVIIILSVSGQVAVRDVERNGLLIRYIKSHNDDTPLFMNVYNNYVYLSSSILLTATNLSTGNVEKKIKLTSPITGLAAFESNIFTTAFTGIVRCYHDGKVLKMAYGAGHESLTCIYVYQGWVFTGNRNGVVSVFQFDPFSEYHCQISNCKNVYLRLEDLDRHVTINSDHKLISKNNKCPWKKCSQTFKDWNEEARKSHLKTHIERLL